MLSARRREARAATHRSTRRFPATHPKLALNRVEMLTIQYGHDLTSSLSLT
jgi:hypothetical protein